MRTAALISQPLRWAYLVADVLDADTDDTWLVVGSPLLYDAKAEMPSGAELTVVDDGLDRLRMRSVNSMRSRFLDWSRGTSRLGPTVEQGLRRVLTIVRSQRSLPRAEPEPAPNPGWLVNRTESLVKELELCHLQMPFERIVVFDLFDLPAALTFAEPKSIEVVVR